MNIALVDGKTVLKVGDYRSIFPQTSFGPDGPSDAFLAENNAMKVSVWLPYDAATQKLASCPPYIQGNFVYTIRVEALTPEEQQARIDSQWANVRAQRNNLLSGSDWTQLPDVPMSDDLRQQWVAYRAALRNVTNQPDPFNITWPMAPDSPLPVTDGGNAPAPAGDAPADGIQSVSSGEAV